LQATRGTRRRRSASARPGNALIEFLLCIPVIVFIAGLTMYMSMAMVTRQDALVEARYELWTSASNNAWSLEQLDGFDPSSFTPPKTGYGQKPRGYGEELDRLRPEVEPKALAATQDTKAGDYWRRLWDNLPGRSNIEVSKTFTSSGKMWDFIDHTAMAQHWRDASEWRYYHLDAWKIMRTGPLQEIYNAFNDHLQASVAPHFQQVHDDIMSRWWDTGKTNQQDPDINGGYYGGT
jgi:hypothetical protein